MIQSLILYIRHVNFFYVNVLLESFEVVEKKSKVKKFKNARFFKNQILVFIEYMNWTWYNSVEYISSYTGLIFKLSENDLHYFTNVCHFKLQVPNSWRP